MRRPAWLNNSQAILLVELLIHIFNCSSIRGYVRADATNPKQNFLVWKLSKLSKAVEQIHALSKLSKAVEQIHATLVFTYGGLRAEH